MSFYSLVPLFPVARSGACAAENFIGGEYLNLGYNRCGRTYGYDGYFTRGFGIYVLLGRGRDGQHIAFEPGAPAVGFGDGEGLDPFLGHGEVLRSAEFQCQRRALDDEIHLLGFGQNDLVAVGEREGYVVSVLYDAFDERVAVFTFVSVCAVLADLFDRLSVFAFDGFSGDLPVAVLVDGRGFAVLSRNRNLVLVVVEQPLVIAAQRPVIDAFDL